MRGSERPQVERPAEEAPAPRVFLAFLVQLAACHARIGPFADGARATPFAGAGCYRAASRRTLRPGSRLA
jgi:hypothetical protein